MSRQAKAYGAALYQLAAEEGLTHLLLEQLEGVDKVLAENPAYIRLLNLPSLPQKERMELVQQAFGQQVHGYLLNVLKLMTQAAAVDSLHGCWLEYRRLYDQEQGILRAVAVSAVPMTQQQQQALTQKLEQMTGKTVYLTNRVEEDCLGGVRLDLDGRQLDGTVQARLARLRSLLAQPASF